MAVYKDANTNTWRAVFRYTDWQGQRKQTQKRGFATKRAAQAWEREQLVKIRADFDMTFASFVDIYSTDMKNRVKENTWLTKEHIIRTKLLPYFGKRKISEIKPADILAWQNEMMHLKNQNGQPYSPVYTQKLLTARMAKNRIILKFYSTIRTIHRKIPPFILIIR